MLSRQRAGMVHARVPCCHAEMLKLGHAVALPCVGSRAGSGALGKLTRFKRLNAALSAKNVAVFGELAGPLTPSH